MASAAVLSAYEALSMTRIGTIQQSRECDWVPGCYYLVRREVVDRIGLFDPRYFLYFEEVDHCRRVRQAGWRVVYYPDTQVLHIGGESAG